MRNWRTDFRTLALAYVVLCMPACGADDKSNLSDSKAIGKEMATDIATDPQADYLGNRGLFLKMAIQGSGESDRTILNNDHDPQTLMLAALRHADSNLLEDLKYLGTLLTDTDFIARLDPSGDAASYTGLRLGTVLGVLADNRHPYAKNIVVSQIDNKIMQADLLRIQLLVHVLANLDDSSSKIVAYWKSLAKADSPLLFDVVQALCASRSGSAIGLLEEMFLSQQYSSGSKQTWMRQIIFELRDNKVILQSAERLIRGQLPESLRSDLIDVLYDYRPQEWYIGTVIPSPPTGKALSEEARATRQRIAEYALSHMNLSDRQRQTLQKSLK